MPWFDEVWFASITNSLVKTGKFMLDICPLQTQKEVLIYGPVYFLLTSVSIKLFGFSILSFRLVNFAFGIANLFIFYKIIQFFIKDKTWALLTIILIAFDNIYNSNIHGGRMDSVALFFYLLSLLIILNNKLSYKRIFFSGLIAALALLTTPRVGFLFFSFIFIILYYSHNEKITKQIRNITLWGFPIFSLYIIWIIYAFGSFTEFIQYYTNSGKAYNASLVSFLGSNFYFPSYQIIMIFSLLVLTIYGFYTKQVKDYLFIIIALLNIVLFHLIVFDTGAYSIYIIPFYYGLLCYLLHKIQFKQSYRNLKYAIYVLIFIINMGIFSFKIITVLSSQNIRDFRQMDQIVKTFIPKNSKVIGNDRYFYSCIKNNTIFQSIERPFSDKERANYHTNIFKYDYIIISNETLLSDPELLNAYKNDSLALITKYQLGSNKIAAFTNKILKFAGMNISGSYDGVIYKLNKL